MKNIARPIHVYRVEAGGAKSAAGGRGARSWRGPARPWAIGVALAAAVAAAGLWMVYPQTTPPALAPDGGAPAQSKLADEKKLADERAALAAAAAIEAERKANESLKRELEEATAARRATAELLRREQDEASAAQRAASERRQRAAEETALAAARAAEADRAEAERLRREAAAAMAAAQRAASDLAKLEAEQAAALRAANELAKREAEEAAALRAASELARREAEEAAAQRAAGELAKREAEQAAAQRAASEQTKREAERAAAIETQRLAAVTPPPLTRFDGIWGGDYRCHSRRTLLILFHRPLALKVQNGSALFEGGTPDKPGWDWAEGRISDDGQVVMSGKGISSRPENFGTAYNISLAGRFVGDRFQAEGKFGQRDCSVDFKRAER